MARKVVEPKAEPKTDRQLLEEILGKLSLLETRLDEIEGVIEERVPKDLEESIGFNDVSEMERTLNNLDYYLRNKFDKD
jgi:hypothetical protein